MSNLLESIISEDYVSATKIFESRIEEIVEQKLLETKKRVQAEAMGGRTIAQAIKDIEARGMVPRKASDVLQDPRDIKINLHAKQQETSKPKTKAKKRKKLEEKDLMDPNAIPTQTLNRNKSWEDRYKAASERAKALELRGAKGQSKMVNRVYRAYKVGDVIGRTGKSIVGNIARGLADLAEE